MPRKMTLNGRDVMPVRPGQQGGRARVNDIALLPWLLRAVLLVEPLEPGQTPMKPHSAAMMVARAIRLAFAGRRDRQRALADAAALAAAPPASPDWRAGLSAAEVARRAASAVAHGRPTTAPEPADLIQAPEAMSDAAWVALHYAVPANPKIAELRSPENAADRHVARLIERALIARRAEIAAILAPVRQAAAASHAERADAADEVPPVSADEKANIGTVTARNRARAKLAALAKAATRAGLGPHFFGWRRHMVPPAP